MTITLVAAIGKNRELGVDNQLLVKLPNDMKHFRELTLNKICIMGRKTYESIGKPLPKRTNLILSRDTNYDPNPEVYVYSSIKDILREYESYGEKEVDVVIIGGASIYKQWIPYADKIELTIIHNEFNEADSFFPEFSLSDFKVTNNIYNEADENNPYAHSFVTYERKLK